MPLEAVVIVVIAAVVLALFGANRRRKKRSVTRIIVVDNDEDVRIDTGAGDGRRRSSPLKRLLVGIVSVVAGFAVAGLVIVFFVEPEIGPVDPTSPIAFGLYLVFALIIYGIIRAFSRG